MTTHRPPRAVALAAVLVLTACTGAGAPTGDGAHDRAQAATTRSATPGATTSAPSERPSPRTATSDAVLCRWDRTGRGSSRSATIGSWRTDDGVLALTTESDPQGCPMGHPLDEFELGDGGDRLAIEVVEDDCEGRIEGFALPLRRLRSR